MQALILLLQVLGCLGLMATGVLAHGACQFHAERSPLFGNAAAITVIVCFISVLSFLLAALLKQSTY